jgi:hypothetical protein
MTQRCNFGLPVLLMTLLTPHLAFAQTKDLSWKMAVVKMEAGKEVSVPFSRPLAFRDGDKFFLVIVPGADGFIDVLYEDTSGQLAVLYKGAVKSGAAVILPGPTQAFEVTPPDGTEKLHVFFAAQAPASVEALFKALPASSAKLLDAIAAYKTSLSRLAEAPEKPVPMGGTHRGLLDAAMTEFKGKDAYVKTIRFDH